MPTSSDDPLAQGGRPASAGSWRSWKTPMAFYVGLLTGAGALAVILWLQQTAVSQEGEGAAKPKKGANLTVSALLMVARDQPSILYPSRPRESEADWEFFKRNQLVLIKTRSVLNAALREPSVNSLAVIRDQLNPIEWLQERIQGDFPAPEIMRISMSGQNEKELTPIVEAVRDAYLNEIVYKKNQYQVRRLNKLKEMWADSEEMLKGKRASLRMMAKGLGGTDHPSSPENAPALRRELVRVRLAQIDAQAKLTVYKADKNPDKETQAAINNLEKESAFLKEKARLLNEANSQQVDLHWLRDEIVQAETLGREIASNKTKLEVEINAPSRISKIEDAHVSGSK